MSTIKATTLSNLAGSKTVPTDTVVDGSAKAWVNFNGTGTVAIRRAFNVSSITDNGTGDYTLNFTTALPDGNYAPVISSNNTSSNASVSNDNDYASVRTTTAYRFAHLENATLTDASVLCVAIFR